MQKYDFNTLIQMPLREVMQLNEIGAVSDSLYLQVIEEKSHKTFSYEQVIPFSRNKKAKN